jgi:methionyl aminopeptidase
MMMQRSSRKEAHRLLVQSSSSLRFRQRNKSTVGVVNKGDNNGDEEEQQQERRRLRLPVVRRTPVVPHALSPTRYIPTHHHHNNNNILRPVGWYPPYAATGQLPPPSSAGTTNRSVGGVEILDPVTIDRLRQSGALARHVLEVACRSAKVGMTTDDIDALVHETLVDQHNAYPSPLNYMGFPKSVCTSVNEVICHGIPDARQLEFGDVVSFDVSCYLNGVHGDNCGTIIVGDTMDDDDDDDAEEGSLTNTTATPTTARTRNWLGLPQRTEFATDECRQHFATARSLVQATLECLEAGIATVRNGSCLSEIGAACHSVADSYGFSSVSQYRGHGIAHQFHLPPYVSHVRNTTQLTLRTDMVFTIEPMLCQYSADCYEWEEDGWTVATNDGGLAAQFEHMIRVTDHGAEILTTTTTSTTNTTTTVAGS